MSTHASNGLILDRICALVAMAQTEPEALEPQEIARRLGIHVRSAYRYRNALERAGLAPKSAPQPMHVARARVAPKRLVAEVVKVAPAPKMPEKRATEPVAARKSGSRGAGDRRHPHAPDGGLWVFKRTVPVCYCGAKEHEHPRKGCPGYEERGL